MQQWKQAFLVLGLVAASAAGAQAGQAQQSAGEAPREQADRVSRETRREGQGPLVVEPRRGERRHRIELRMSLHDSPGASFVQDGRHTHWGSGNVGGGFEYLHYVSPDLAVGFAIDSQARGEGHSDWWDDNLDNGNATVAMPVVVRWNFARRFTDWRAIEPYVTGGVGPVFRADWLSTGGWRHHSHTSAEVSTTIGGRLGLGFDARLSSVFTLGLAGTWRWSDRPEGVSGYGKEDRGGEVSFTIGFNFGHRSVGR